MNRRKLGSLFERELLLSAVRSLVGAAVMAVAVLFIANQLDSPLLQLLLALPAAVIIYVGTLVLVGGREIRDLASLLHTRRSGL